MSELRLQRKNMKRVFGITGILFIIFIIFMMYISRAIQSYLLPVAEHQKPRKGFLTEKISMEGEVKLYDTKNITALEAYKVLSINIKAGNTINSGDVLLEFDESEIELEIKKKELQKQVLLSEVKSLGENILEGPLSSMEMDVEKLLLILRQEQKNYSSMEAQYNIGAVARASLEEEKNKLDQAQIDYESKKKELDLKKDEVKKTNQQTKEKNSDTMRQKNMEMEILDMEIKKLKKVSDLKGTIKSSISGIVQSVSVEEGENINPGQVLFKVDVKKDEAVIECKVDTVKAEYVSEGDEVFITSDRPKSFDVNGIVSTKKYMPETEKYLVTCRIENPVDIKAYDLQKVSVEYSRNSPAYNLIIPKSCIIEEAQNRYVYILDYKNDENAAVSVKKIRVDIAEEDDLECAVNSTAGVKLKQDDSVVTRSSKALSDGMRVRIKEEISFEAEN